MPSALITPEAANAIIQNQLNTVILDASFGVPDAAGSFEFRHLPIARFFDIEAASDPESTYPHTLPSPESFAATASKLGIDRDTTILIYDQNGIAFAAARAWWMFRVFGHDRVHVINGGLPAWIRAGLPIESGAVPAPEPKTFTAHFRPELYRSYDEIERIAETGDELIVDARPAMRFEAMMHSIDGDSLPAHIPGSANLPFVSLLDSMGAMKDDAAIGAILKTHTHDSGKKLVVSCGSGITACVLALGFFQTGYKNTAVFDGSWTEWSDRQQIR